MSYSRGCMYNRQSTAGSWVWRASHDDRRVCTSQTESLVAVYAETIIAIMQLLECTDRPKIEPRLDDKIHPRAMEATSSLQESAAVEWYTLIRCMGKDHHLRGRVSLGQNAETGGLNYSERYSAELSVQMDEHLLEPSATKLQLLCQERRLTLLASMRATLSLGFNRCT